MWTTAQIIWPWEKALRNVWVHIEIPGFCTFGFLANLSTVWDIIIWMWITTQLQVDYKENLVRNVLSSYSALWYMAKSEHSFRHFWDLVWKSKDTIEIAVIFSEEKHQRLQSICLYLISVLEKQFKYLRDPIVIVWSFSIVKISLNCIFILNIKWTGLIHLVYIYCYVYLLHIFYIFLTYYIFLSCDFLTSFYLA